MRILLTGLGSIGKRHARLLREHPKEFELLAYRSGKSKNECPFDIKEYTDLGEALATNPDVAFITNPTHLHVDTAIRCARKNCHLFIEKPLSDTLENVDDLITEAENRDLVTLVGCQLRFDPVLNSIREILKLGKLGEVRSFRAYSGSYLPEWRPDQDYRKSYSADPEKGGGVVLDLIHEIDYTYWLFEEPVRTRSEISHVDSLEIESEAIAEAIVRTHGGAVGNIHLSYCRRQPRRTLEVVCDQGILIGDLEDGSLTTEKPEETDHESFDYERDDRFRRQLEYFIDHVKREEACENDISEGKEVLKTALQIKKNDVRE